MSEDELEDIRKRVELNQYEYEIEEGVFDIREYNDFLSSVKEESEEFKMRKEKALEEAIVGY